MTSSVFGNEIDPRSFKVFAVNGDRLLFDRATGVTAAVDDGTYEALERMQLGAYSGNESGDGEDGESIETMRNDLIHSLQLRGFFRYAPVDHGEQEKLIERLWRHRPRRIQLLMAQGCNLGCRYCYAWRNGSNQKATLMPFDVAKAAVDHLIQNSGNRCDLQVTFFGGEPLLNYEVIREVVRYCHEVEGNSQKQFTFELITNGTLLNQEVTDWIASEKFWLFVSIDGWKEMHNHNRPSMSGDDMYETIVRNALYANSVYTKQGLKPIKVRANLTNRFRNGIAVGDYLASLGFHTIGVGPIEPLPHGDPSPSALTEDQMDEYHAEIWDRVSSAVDGMLNGVGPSKFISILMNKTLSRLLPARLKGVTCGVGRNTQVVDNKGNIFPCHRYEGMEAYIIGNVLNGGLDRERTMAYYRKLNGNATKRCHSCWIRDYCGGGCAWLLSAKDGHLADPTERECDRRRKSMEMALWLRQKMRRHFPERFREEGEIDLESWDWGSADEYNEATCEEVAKLEFAQGKQSSCGSGCETCSPSGCSD